MSSVGHQIAVAAENAWLGRKAAEVELLRQMDQVRSDLIANVSHELRTPLGLIRLLCTTLLRDDIDTIMHAFDAYVPDKMSHQPVTFIKAGGENAWVKIDGLVSTRDLLAELEKIRGGGQ